MGLYWQFLLGLGAPDSTVTFMYPFWLFKTIDSYGDLILDNQLKQIELRQAQFNRATRKDPFIETETSCWNKVVADHPDVFAEPGMPAERETKHKIELLPGAMPQYRH